MMAMNEGPIELNLELLPTEILLGIFSMLDYCDRITLNRVSRRFNSITSDANIWKNIVGRDISSSELSLLKNILTQYSGSIMKIDICGWIELSDFLTQLIPCKAIHSITLLGVKNEILMMKSLVEALPNLTHLEFEPRNSGCDMFRCRHSMCQPREWRAFFSSCVRLQNACFLLLWTDHMVEFILREWILNKGYPVQLSLNFFTIHDLSPGGTNWDSHYSNTLSVWKELQSSLQSFDHAARFSFRSFRPASSSRFSNPPLFEVYIRPDGTPYTAITAATLAGLDGAIQFCETSLQTGFASSACYFPENKFTLSSSQAIVDNFSQLKTSEITSLKLNNAANLEPIHLETVANCCPNLSTLSIEGCTKCLNPLFGIVALAHQCKRMRSLSFLNIHSAKIESVSELWRLLSQMTQLLHLAPDLSLLTEIGIGVSSTAPDPNADTTTGFKLPTVEAELDTTSVLNNISSLYIQDEMFRTGENKLFVPNILPEYTPQWTYLRHLRLECLTSNCSESLITSTLMHCKYLTSLHLSSEFSLVLSSTAFYEAKLKQLFIKCPRLNLANELVDSLVRRNTLTHLYLFARSITKESMYNLLQNGTKLVSFHAYTRDRPVFVPPIAYLEFQEKMKQLLSVRVPKLDDFLFEEDTKIHLWSWIKNSTIKSIYSSDVM